MRRAVGGVHGAARPDGVVHRYLTYFTTKQGMKSVYAPFALRIRNVLTALY
jgi:hypothetical protein